MNSTWLWYLTRSTAITAFLLMTVTMVLGIASTQRALASPRWPRFATQRLHRNASILGILFLAVHIVTSILDTYVNISWYAGLVPFTSGYRTLWVSFGTVAVDIFAVLIISSLLRDRLSARTWRRIHLLAYAAWPLAFVHFWQTGTDAEAGRFGLWIDLVCLAVVVSAVALRLTAGRRSGLPSTRVPSLAGAR